MFIALILITLFFVVAILMGGTGNPTIISNDTTNRKIKEIELIQKYKFYKDFIDGK